MRLAQPLEAELHNARARVHHATVDLNKICPRLHFLTGSDGIFDSAYADDGEITTGS